jgi:hypothetical protein
MRTPFIRTNAIQKNIEIIVGYSEAQNAVRFIYNLKSREDLSVFQLGLAGGLGAAPMSLVVAPAEQIKIQLQTSTQTMTQVLRSMMVNKSHRAMLRNGVLLTGLRDVPGGFLYFSTYEYVKILLPPQDYGLWMVPVAGGISYFDFFFNAMKLQSKSPTADVQELRALGRGC